MFKIMDCFFQPFWDTEVLKITAEDAEAFEEYSEGFVYRFFYALVWSLGVTTDEAGRDTFEAKLRELAGEDNTQ